jgi:2-haloacid dehalogenase
MAKAKGGGKLHPLPFTTFGEIAALGLKATVHCSACYEHRPIDPTVEMLEAPMRNSGLEGLLEAPLSTDRVQAYKPDPRAYQMGLDAFGLKREEIVFAASASWDAAGAKAFGYPSFWVNRANLPVEALGAAPDAIGSGMADLVAFVAG